MDIDTHFRLMSHQALASEDIRRQFKDILMGQDQSGIGMADFLSHTGRSERMSRIRSADTKPEVALRKVLPVNRLRLN